MLIQKVLKNHIKFLNDVQANLEEIIATTTRNTEVSRLLSNGFHMLKEKDRKTVSKVLLTDLSVVTGYREADIVDLVAQLHYTSAMGIVSTTESDLYDLVYCMDIPLMITRMKHRYAEVESMMA
jgi:chromosome condensin MukBEF MukE localization factor